MVAAILWQFTSVFAHSLLEDRGLYALLLGVPAVALVRQYGSGRAFEPFGLPVFAGFDSGKISWMTGLGSLLHSNFGWVLLLAIVGHVSMVVWHRRKNAKQDVLPRMLG